MTAVIKRSRHSLAGLFHFHKTLMETSPWHHVLPLQWQAEWSAIVNNGFSNGSSLHREEINTCICQVRFLVILKRSFCLLLHPAILLEDKFSWKLSPACQHDDTGLCTALFFASVIQLSTTFTVHLKVIYVCQGTFVISVIILHYIGACSSNKNVICSATCAPKRSMFHVIQSE